MTSVMAIFAWPFNDNTAHKESIFLTASFEFLSAWTNLLEFLLFSSPTAVLASGWCYLFVFAHNRFRWAAFTLACHDQTSNHELTGGLTGSECICVCVCEREDLMCLCVHIYILETRVSFCVLVFKFCHCLILCTCLCETPVPQSESGVKISVASK